MMDLVEYLLPSTSDGDLKVGFPVKARRRVARLCKIVAADVSGRKSCELSELSGD
jgi:hypothetical protein